MARRGLGVEEGEWRQGHGILPYWHPAVLASCRTTIPASWWLVALHQSRKLCAGKCILLVACILYAKWQQWKFLLQTPMGRQRLRQMVCQSEIEKRKWWKCAKWNVWHATKTATGAAAPAATAAASGWLFLNSRWQFRLSKRSNWQRQSELPPGSCRISFFGTALKLKSVLCLLLLMKSTRTKKRDTHTHT